MKRLLLLLSARSYRAPDFIAAARKLGVQLVIGTDEEPTQGTSAAGAIVRLDLRPVDRSVARIRRLAEELPFDAVIAADDTGAALAALASAELNLPANPSESVVSSQNKFVFRDILHAAGLPTPWYRQFPLASAPVEIISRIRFPCVIKPLHLQASRGVIRANSPGEFIAAFARVKAILERPEVRDADPSLAGQVLVEGYLDGAEAALEGIVHDGEFRLLAFFDKPDPLEGPFFQETLYVTPSRHPISTQQAAVAAVGAAVRALGLRMGPVHAEVRIHRGQATLLDLAPRSIGGHCGRSLRFGHGHTLEELILIQALGLEAPPTERERPAAGVLMVPIPRAGILREVGGVAEAARVPGVVEVEIAIPPGEQVEPPPEGNRYLGFVFSRASSPGRAEAALRAAGALLDVVVDPIGPFR